MTLAVGDLVRVIDDAHINMAVGSSHFVTAVHDTDGTIELEGMSGRLMANRFEVVPSS